MIGELGIVVTNYVYRSSIGRDFAILWKVLWKVVKTRLIKAPES